MVLAHVLGAEAESWDGRALLCLLSSCTCLGVYSWCDVHRLDPHCELSLRISLLMEGKEEEMWCPIGPIPFGGLCGVSQCRLEPGAAFFLMLVVPRSLLVPSELLFILNLSVLMLSIPEKGLWRLLPSPKGD